MKFIESLIENEEGGFTLLMLPVILVTGTLIVALIFNIMIMNGKKNEIQIMADSATRAGSLAVKYSFAVKERSGHGWGDYHVYTQLDENLAKELSSQVIQEFQHHSPTLIIDSIEENPIGFKVPVWNSRNFNYDEKVLSPDKQYKNGNFSMLVNGRVDGVWGGLLGIPNEIPIKIYSQSSARAKVIGIGMN